MIMASDIAWRGCNGGGEAGNCFFGQVWGKSVSIDWWVSERVNKLGRRMPNMSVVAEACRSVKKCADENAEACGDGDVGSGGV